MTQNSENAPTVLIVDDEKHIRSFVRLWLTAEGYRCAEADSAVAAWTYLQEHEVQLVTLDVNMPGRSGVDLLSDITKAYPDVAVIMLTAAGKTDTAITSLMHGALRYLLKPFMREEFVFHARRALERRQLILENRQHVLHLEEKVREQTIAIRRTQEEIIHKLVSVSLRREGETAMHIQRIGLFSELLAKAAGWSAIEAENLRMAAQMHDVGKIAIPDTILRKPGKLTPEESRVMKTHTTVGAQILSGSDTSLLKMAQQIALNHHEHWDGEGYPRGLAREAIPESASYCGHRRRVRCNSPWPCLPVGNPRREIAGHYTRWGGDSV